MIKVEYFFSAEPEKDEPLDYELGYFSIYSDNELLYDGKSNQNHMIFLSVADILLALADYFEKNKNRTELILPDSSINMCFIKNSGNTRLEINNKVILDIQTNLLVNAFYIASKNFFQNYSSDINSAVKYDLEYALSKFNNGVL